MKLESSVMTIFSLSYTIAKAQIKADDVVGNWVTAGKEAAKILVHILEDKFYGKIIWLKNATDNGKSKVDINNPDKTKRTNLIIGLVILKGFKFERDDGWKGRDVYDPESDKIKNSHFYLKDKNTLRIRGYVGISLFGRTETWIRTN